MLASCEYMPEELQECVSESCEVYPVDEGEVPPHIQSIDSREFTFEIDGWARHDMPSEDYYDMNQFREAYTGYQGQTIWNFIHEKICFSVDHPDLSWKRDFNRAVCGLHSMISSQVARSIGEYEALAADDPDNNSDSGHFGEDDDDDEEENCPMHDSGHFDASNDDGVDIGDLTAVSEFKRRLSTKGENPNAISDLHFAYALLLSAVDLARDRYQQEIDSGAISVDSGSALELSQFLKSDFLASMHENEAGQNLKAHASLYESSSSSDTGVLWEARMRTRELYRIMNCVQCNKCKFHGKVAVLGISTAFQILLGIKGENRQKEIHRVELAALITTVSKFSQAVDFCRKMEGSEGMND